MLPRWPASFCFDDYRPGGRGAQGERLGRIGTGSGRPVGVHRCPDVSKRPQPSQGYPARVRVGRVGTTRVRLPLPPLVRSVHSGTPGGRGHTSWSVPDVAGGDVLTSPQDARGFVTDAPLRRPKRPNHHRLRSKRIRSGITARAGNPSSSISGSCSSPLSAPVSCSPGSISSRCHSCTTGSVNSPRS